MLEEADYCNKLSKERFNKRLTMTPDDEYNFRKSTVCHICGKGWNTSKERKRPLPCYGGILEGLHMINAIRYTG